MEAFLRQGRRRKRSEFGFDRDVMDGERLGSEGWEEIFTQEKRQQCVDRRKNYERWICEGGGGYAIYTGCKL